MELRSPCRGCDLEFEDKNNERCDNWRAKLAYAGKMGDMPKEALERFDNERSSSLPIICR